MSSFKQTNKQKTINRATKQKYNTFTGIKVGNKN